MPAYTSNLTKTLCSQTKIRLQRKLEIGHMKQQIIQFSGLAFLGTVFFVAALSVTVMLASWDGVVQFLFGAA